MLSLSRHASKQNSRPLLRSLAQVVGPNTRDHNPNLDASEVDPRRRRQRATKLNTTPSASPSTSSKVAVREDHGLYAFFRKVPRKADSPELVGEDRYEVVETPEEGQLLTGRAWEAAELRNKSFKDLHTLWYVALREKNLLATQKEEVRRMGVTSTDLQVSKEKVRNCRKTMARIKAVLNERRLAFEGAMKLAEKESDAAKAEEMAKSKRPWDPQDKKIVDYLHKSRAKSERVWDQVVQNNFQHRMV
ncbi:hypothetical protein M413DRAFT_444015 [Hebeloma cylindrosporum]|uniref:Large ribosomal subunit protein uL29m n=1 Tax=Hebeloma cylindrosporum TaxID=76867 RepID=A0A0C3CHY4_HEBCY|nr:hypothetical protein M413DRAFT_444015 [Hebeloma cylindrosporum h7]